MRVELTRLRVKEGQSARVDDWLNMLHLITSERGGGEG